MDDRKLLNQVSLLKDIKPRQEWVLLTKQKILGGEVKEQSFSILQVLSYLSYLRKPAFAFASFVLLAGTSFAFVMESSIPEDRLYGAKVALEKVRVSLSPREQRQTMIAQNRLEDVKKVAETKDQKKLASAINEYRQSAAKASEDFARLVEKEPEKALQASKLIIQLQKDKTQLEKVLGTIIGEQEEGQLESASRILLENEFTYLETRTLTENQAVLFEEARDAYEKGDYPTALEKIWTLSNNQ